MNHLGSIGRIAACGGKLAPFLALGLLLALLLVGGAIPPALAQQTQQRGLFGMITAIQDMGLGLTVLAVEDSEGATHEIEVLDELTIVMVPGQDLASARDLAVGDSVGALVLERPTTVNINTASVELLASLPLVGPVRAEAIVNYREQNGPFEAIDEIVNVLGIGSGVFDAIRLQIVVNDRVQALRVMVKPSRSVLSSHFTGVVLGVGLGQIILMDAKGNRVEFSLPPSAAPLSPGDVVTVTTRLDPKLGTVLVGGLDSAEASLERLSEALSQAEQAGAQQSLENLKDRLLNAAGGQLTTLQDVGDLAPPGSVPGIGLALTDARRLLAGFGLGGPLVVVSGIVDLVDPEAGVVGLTSEGGTSIELTLELTTTIEFEGQPVPLHEELFGRVIQATYDPATGTARAIEILPPRGLAEEVILAALPWALVGEVEGSVADLDLSSTPPSLTIQPLVGDAVTLSVPDAARILLEGQSASLGDLFLQLQVKVRYDTDRMEALQVESFEARAGEAFVAGVVKGLVRKEARRVTIVPSSGLPVTLNITDDTILEREGLRVPINDIMLGDLVRPTTRYNNTTFDLIKLAVKSPLLPITGVVRSIEPGAGRITLAAPERGILTLLVTDDTEITRLGEESDLGAIELGEGVGAGSVYNAATLEAQRLVITPPKTLQVRGTISDLNTRDFIVTVSTLEGESLVLLVPNKPGIVIHDGAAASFLQLGTGDVVQELFYRPKDNVVVRLVASSR